MGFKGQTTPPHNLPEPPVGVLLTNLGTPDAPTPKALRRYLRQFLSDPRVVEIPRLLWWFILHLFILPLRPRASAKLYQQIWTDEGSPLLDISRRQAGLLQQRLDSSCGEGKVKVVLGMRYGNPSMDEAVNELAESRARHLVVLPLYPQYSGSTTGSTFDELGRVLSDYRWVPKVSFINGYQSHPAYIDALCASVHQHIQQYGLPQRWVFSYHGTPQRYLEQGDPYYCFCVQTTRLVRERLGLDEWQVLTTFQSRFGKAPWLQPYTDKTLESLPEQGVTNVAVICPGFSSDCLETLEEIEGENFHAFITAGGEQFHYIPCLNDSPGHIEMMARLIEENM
ncbi:ferrochelatase [Porticoccus sp. W117]|uniref:ferrochelatase n=1 Tax=Porticoccus sp. W117 TaxID=3054777 RepID=UPI002598CF00|nr:ferrochelatase [Porticoccus sp. W117]MDM3870015.1 ferrochelatase [Porticoccus sp. W117]